MKPLLPLSLLLVLGLTMAADAAPRPTIYIVGDSSVRNGQGDGAGGLWGWGSFLSSYFDTNRVKISNRAQGGSSSRSFYREGLWDKVRLELKPGDVVLMQFGHNDAGQLFTGDRPRASLKGIGEESEDGVVEATGRAETVRTYGWYLRHYITGTKAAGAVAIVLSPVPRNYWKSGRVVRANQDYARWAREAAQAARARFIDLNEVVARRYEEFGQTRVTAEFFGEKDPTHFSRAGAMFNAECVATGLRAIVDFPLAAHLIAPRPAGSTPAKSILAPARPAGSNDTRRPAPDKLVVLTFDDAPLSHYTNVAPILKRFGFGATFFVCEFPEVFGKSNLSMNWDQIQRLHLLGFEIGNHTRTHRHVDRMEPAELEAELGYIEKRCADLGIPRPVSFAYPAYVTTPAAVKTLTARGYRYARGGGGKTFRPASDDPLLIPSFSASGANEKAAAHVLDALRQARPGQVVVLTVHGVPDYGHPEVSTAPHLFERYLHFLKSEGCTVVALRDLANFRWAGK